MRTYSSSRSARTTTSRPRRGSSTEGYEFYSVAGAVKLRDILPTFQGGTVVVGVMTPHYKCPPAPSEAAMLMHDYLTERGLRGRSRIIMTTAMPSPLPVSKEAGDAILARFGELGIECHVAVMPTRVDGAARRFHLSNGVALDYDLLLAVPVHVAPPVVLTSGLAEDGWIPVDRATLRTRFPDVYAIGDVTSVGTPRAGTFAEGAGRVVAAEIIARSRGGDVARYQGDGHCYIEFGEQQIRRNLGELPRRSEADESVHRHHSRGHGEEAPVRLHPRESMVRALGPTGEPTLRRRPIRLPPSSCRRRSTRCGCAASTCRRSEDRRPVSAVGPRRPGARAPAPRAILPS